MLVALALAGALIPAAAHADRGCHTSACKQRVEKRQQVHRHYSFCNTWRCVERQRRRERQRLQRQARRLPPLVRCIIRAESGGNPRASNGSHFGIGQWTIEAWHRHGGGRFAQHPFGASYAQQVWVLKNGLARYGCRDWCPFDPC